MDIWIIFNDSGTFWSSYGPQRFPSWLLKFNFFLETW